MILGRLLFLALLLAVVGTAIAVVYARQQSRVLFVQLSELGNERDNVEVEFGRLQLEQATWAENSRIEQIARGKLGMVSTSAAETVLIKR